MGAFISSDPLSMVGASVGMSDDMVLGLSIVAMLRNPAAIAANWKSVKQFGHTFSRHGAGTKNTERLLDRAKGTGTDQGQWLDNDKAAEVLSKIKLDGPASIRLPDGLGQVIKPDGAIISAEKALLVPSATGLKTAYPILP